MNISQKIYKLRTENGYSQEELAEKLKVPSRYVEYWEDGFTPELAVIIELSNIFNVSTDYLLKDDVDNNVIEEEETEEEAEEEAEEETEEETEKIQYAQPDEDIIRGYVDKTKSRGEDIGAGLMLAIWSLIPLLNYNFDIFVIFDFTEGALFKIISIIISGIGILIALTLLFVGDTKFDDIDYSTITFNSSEKYTLKCMYNDFKNTYIVIMFLAIMFEIISIISIIVLEPLSYPDFATYLISDILLFIIGCATCAIIYIKNEDITFKKILKEIEIQHVEGVSEVEQIQGFSQSEEVYKVESNNANLDGVKVQTYIASKKNQAKLISDGIFFISLSIIPLAFYYYDLLESIHNKDLREYTNIFMIFLIIIYALVGIVHFITVIKLNETLELNQNGGLILNREEKMKFDEMYITFKKDSSYTLVRKVVVFIVIAVIGSITIGVFNLGNIMRFIILDVLIILIGGIIGSLISTIYTKNGYKTVINYVGEVQKNRNKKGVRLLDVKGVDEYLNNRIRVGKNLGKGIIFLAIGSIPFIPYFYSHAGVFNRTSLYNTPIFIVVLSIICNLIALYFLIKLMYLANEVKPKNNNDFILNEFAENKVKFKYEKFKNKKIVKIILSIVIYLSAIIATTYLYLMFKDNEPMFNGTIHIFYELVGAIMFLYALATYFVITIHYEQKAYKTLLRNVDK